MAKRSSSQRRVPAKPIQSSVQQQLLLSIMRSTDDAIISRTLDGKILTWNEGAERLYGYKMSEMVGKQIRIIVPEDVPADDQEISEKLRKGERIDHYVTTRCRKDGSKVVIDLTVFPLLDRKGRIIGVASIARDITAQNMLMNRQREFVSIASHELRTPLTALTGYLSLAQSAADAVQAKEFTDRAFMAAQRLTKLVEDLLEVARLEEDRVVLDLTPFGPAPVVVETIEELASASRQKRLELRLKNDLGVRDLIKADPGKFHQVIRNLLDNALKYTPPGGRVTVGMSAKAGRVRIKIRDTGIGIDEKNLEKIFDKFFREYTELSVAAGGTGLGLFITKQLVDRMGGSLQIRSRRKVGTAVTIEFPRAAVPRKRPAPKGRSAARPGATMRKRK